MELDKSFGIWDSEEPTLHDDVAYYLYCKDKKESLKMIDIRGRYDNEIRIEPQNWFVTHQEDYRKYYNFAKFKMISEKINKITTNIPKTK